MRYAHEPGGDLHLLLNVIAQALRCDDRFFEKLSGGSRRTRTGRSGSHFGLGFNFSSSSTRKGDACKPPTLRRGSFSNTPLGRLSLREAFADVEQLAALGSGVSSRSWSRGGETVRIWDFEDRLEIAVIGLGANYCRSHRHGLQDRQLRVVLYCCRRSINQYRLSANGGS